jgi:hypothetical protein
MLLGILSFHIQNRRGRRVNLTRRLRQADRAAYLTGTVALVFAFDAVFGTSYTGDSVRFSGSMRAPASPTPVDTSDPQASAATLVGASIVPMILVGAGEPIRHVAEQQRDQ